MTRLEQMQKRLEEMTLIEKELWAGGTVIAGMDEVGRGPLAGPVAAACVIMPEAPLIPGINDSKKLSEKRREELFEEIKRTAIGIGIGIVDNNEIDEINILNATKKAMRLAYEDMGVKAGIVLIDALDIELPCKVMPIIKGDSKSYAIAAASIVAKVTRDRMMIEYGNIYPCYLFAKNKGYGTGEHIEAILEKGTCPLHRKSFLGGILNNA